MRADADSAAQIAKPESGESARRDRNRATLFLLQASSQRLLPVGGGAGDRTAKETVRLAAHGGGLFTEVPFERASQIFERLTGIKMSDHCQHQVAAQVGEVAEPPAC